MKTREFVAEICRRTHFESIDAALRASRATLLTLGECMHGDAPRHLAEQLPREMAKYLRGGGAGHGAKFTPQEFLRRVSEREGVDVETARVHARAVVEVLYEAVSAAERRIRQPARWRSGAKFPTRH